VPDASPADSLLAVQHEGRRRFLELVADLRPELHRYCARMSEPLDAVHDSAADPAPDPGDAIAHQQVVQLAVSRFVGLAPAQRSCVILKDVLGHSLEDIGGLLELSLPAVKAALHRGRLRLRELAAKPQAAPPVPASSPSVARYVALFNARDWDGVRAMLAEDVQLDLVSRAQRQGSAVGNYLSNYDLREDWRLAPAWLEGREVIAVFRAPGDARPGYFIELGVADGKIRFIHDFRYVPYIMRDARIELASNRGPSRPLVIPN
jgi:DNA-directed RNA polymerase specialized sigma24 family protein